MKKFSVIMSLILSALLFLSCPVLAGTEMGKVTPAKPGVNIQLFGSLKTFPHFVDNLDFNKDDTIYNWILDESGIIDDDEMTVRNELRVGMKGGGENWKFLVILESDFALDKENADRGARIGEISTNLGMTGEDFAVEKLDFSYDFSAHGLPVTVETGWNTKWLDIETGGVLYGDDHPYIGFKGTSNGISWELLNLIIYDRIAGTPGPPDPLDGESPDWRVYSAKMAFPAGDMKVSPFYAFSDNNARDANVHYFGIQTFGKMGNLSPKAEFVYALGEKDNFTTTGGEGDISAFAGFASIEMSVEDMFNPYFGGYFVSGDDDASDEDIEAFNPITNISRYAGPFAMENAFIYRYVPVLGTHLYSNTFDTLGTAGGYGGISNSSSANSPGMYNLGIGTKGAMDKWSYKAQFVYFWFAETGALEDVEGKCIDDAVGLEFDLQVTYHFSKNFSLGNVFALFDPGDGVQDLRGEDYDQMAILNTVELKWTF
ncbi:MAG: hypothetical protein HF978_08260 [Desulfobacteraceae bacterium]|nr:hypothetical protein [Desulfobacteraceae bacterium]MBC2755523.1 hypothetical protein [Desulfobacteraceae bacterium]